MKKVYEKPQVYMERFELAEHIAGCSLTLLNDDVTKCTATGIIAGDRSDFFFISGNGSCSVPVDAYCETNSTINVTTIMS